MTGPGVVVGARRGPFPARLDAAFLRRYAQAIHDPSPRVQAGEVVPATAIVTQIWHAQNEGRKVAVPAELREAATGGVHGEHSVLLYRPLIPGEVLEVWVEGHGARPAGRNAAVTLKYGAVDTGGDLVAEQWWTTVFLGVTCQRVGQPPPDHSFPDAARAHPVGTYTVEIDAGMARRYAEVSGDWSDHHFDLAAARRSGSDRPFLHGLCTMALCAQGVTQLVAGGDTERVRRVAVRFATPAFLGELLQVRVCDAGPLGYAFEADAAGATVITHGRVELW